MYSEHEIEKMREYRQSLINDNRFGRNILNGNFYLSKLTDEDADDDSD